MADPTDFVAALTDWLAAQSGLTGTSSIRLWAHAIDQAVVTIEEPVSRLTQYGGQPLATAPVGHSLIQCYTRHKSAAKAMSQALLLRRKLCGLDGLPVQDVAIAGFAMKSVCNLTTPAMIGRDPQQRPEVVFNFECNYLPA